MPDFAKYSTIPYKLMGRDHAGVDCWGLCYLILRDEFGVDIPAYSEDRIDPEDEVEIAALIGGEIGSSRWAEQTPGTEQLGDVVLLRVFGLPVHCGVVTQLKPERKMLHSIENSGVLFEPYNSQRWARRVLGIYRYVGYN